MSVPICSIDVKEHEKPETVSGELRASGSVCQYLAVADTPSLARTTVRGYTTHGVSQPSSRGPDWKLAVVRYFTVNCPNCRAKLGPFSSYRPGLIRCGNCGKPFNLR